ncbi:hypothetical protein [Corynebacterium halotolerans]|uniref:Uncharacterized protein n=1 Tax=Corynebacterium halotolerans YIM 70093 = DSM 44683 TaxID=1121362 RepID=M1MYH6_9CORY|nr:hypothetical protein [Corynebacterium halotolerans]AGF72784.1 hypothetical protein A605_08910 [Corynebacterium halotolerans YIM 70093 = DSM 44683]
MATTTRSKRAPGRNLEETLFQATGMPSINAIATEAGITPSTLWRHVKESRLTVGDYARLIPLLDRVGADNEAAQQLRRAAKAQVNRTPEDDVAVDGTPRVPGPRLVDATDEQLLTELQRRADALARRLSAISRGLENYSDTLHRHSRR